MRRVSRRRTLTTQSRCEPGSPQHLHRAGARQAAGPIGGAQGRVEIRRDRCCAGVVPVARWRRPARGSDRQAPGPALAPVQPAGARPEHPDRNGGALCPLLPTSYFLLPTSYFLLPTSYFLTVSIPVPELGESRPEAYAKNRPLKR
ncbi:hypothetical protein J2W37_000701 [Variovorax paradoxus]|nr:hypothetical protein [Variovorax paradoxus]